MNQLPFPQTARRMPLFGLGCLAGAAGDQSASPISSRTPERRLCSSRWSCGLTLQKEDLGVANIVASGLFGDGGAAVVMVGDEHPLAAQAPVRVEAARSHFVPDSERVMGWDVVDSGFKVVLAPTVAEIVADEMARSMPCSTSALFNARTSGSLSDTRADQGLAQRSEGSWAHR